MNRAENFPHCGQIWKVDLPDMSNPAVAKPDDHPGPSIANRKVRSAGRMPATAAVNIHRKRRSQTSSTTSRLPHFAMLPARTPSAPPDDQGTRAVLRSPASVHQSSTMRLPRDAMKCYSQKRGKMACSVGPGNGG
jgi:hypothetical protein